jgi:O-antigen ligase
MRWLLFGAYACFCLRTLVVVLATAPPADRLLMLAWLLIVVLATAIAPFATLMGLAIALPAINGAAELHLLPPLPPFAFTVSAFFCTWLLSRLMRRHWHLRSPSGMGTWIDLLVFFTLVSLAMQLLQLPLDFGVYIWTHFINVEQSHPLHFMAAAGVLLHGLFFCRQAEIILAEHGGDAGGQLVFAAHALMLISGMALGTMAMALGLPLLRLDALGFPLGDPHSWGSYAVFLFFVMALWPTKPGQERSLWPMALAVLLLVGIAYSRSRGTYFALALTTGIILVRHGLPSKWRRPVVGLIGAILIALSVWSWKAMDLQWRPGHLLESISTELMHKDFYKLRTVYTRLVNWDRAIAIMSEHPLTGSGVGTYFRVAPQFDTPLNARRWIGFSENAHNYYLQLGAELGIVALVTFGILILASLRRLDRVSPSLDGHKGVLYGLIAYGLTLITNHSLLLPVQWLLFGFAMAHALVLSGREPAPRHQGAPVRHRSVANPMLATVFGILAVAGQITLPPAADGRLTLREYGFYPYEYRGNVTMRWMMGRGGGRLPITGPVLSFDVAMSPANIGDKGLRLTVGINGRTVDQITFTEAVTRTLTYPVPEPHDGWLTVQMSVDHTYRPYREGHNRDARLMGIAVSPFRFTKEPN